MNLHDTLLILPDFLESVKRIQRIISRNCRIIQTHDQMTMFLSMRLASLMAGG